MCRIDRSDKKLVDRLLALRPHELEDALAHVISTWPADRLLQDAVTYLNLTMRLNAETDPAIVVQLAEMRGEVKERLRWRAGRVPRVNATVEKLALERIKPRLNLAGGEGGERDAANARRHAEAEKWREIARKVACEKQHLRGGSLEQAINRELKRQGFDEKAGRTIREALKNISRTS